MGFESLQVYCQQIILVRYSFVQQRPLKRFLVQIIHALSMTLLGSRLHFFHSNHTTVMVI